MRSCEFSNPVDCVWPSFHFAERFYSSFCIMSIMGVITVLIAWHYMKSYRVIVSRTGTGHTQNSSFGISISDINNTQPPKTDANSSIVETPSFFAKIAYCLLRLMLALYISLAQRTLQIFACEQQTALQIDADYTSADNIGIISYMVAAPYIDCRSVQYTVLFFTALFVAVAFIVAFPILLLVLLFKMRQLFDQIRLPSRTTSAADSSSLSLMQQIRAPIEFTKYSHQLEIDMRYIFDFQLAAVRPEMWWWPTGMLTLRSLVLAILVSALPIGSIWLPLLIVMLLVVTLLLHTHYHPYHHAGDNYLEIVMITHVLLAYFAQILVDALNFTGSDASDISRAGNTYIFHMFDPAGVAAIGEIVNGVFAYILFFGAVAYRISAWICLDQSLTTLNVFFYKARSWVPFGDHEGHESVEMGSVTHQ